MGVDVDGAFAEYVLRPPEALIVPRAPVPPVVLAVLTDAVATPLHGLKRVAKLQPGETLVVLGVGGLGSNAVQLGKAMGARVIAVTRSAAKLRLARELGADETVAADDGDPVAAVKALTGGHGPDVVIQCVGSAAVDEEAIAMGGPGGRVVHDRGQPGPVPGTSDGDLLAGAGDPRVARVRPGRHPRRHRPVP